MQYATEEELRVWMDVPEVPSRASVALRSASWVIRRATSGALYAVTADGLPRDEAAIEAFRDATLTQAAFWLANDIDPSAGMAGIPRPIQAKSLNGASVTYQGDNTNAALVASLSHPVPMAYAILKSARLITARLGRTAGVSAHYVESPVF